VKIYPDKIFERFNISSHSRDPGAFYQSDFEVASRTVLETKRDMKHKKSQLIMIWLLPIIVIGGLFNPYLGYLVVAMMAVLLTLSFFKRRYWCWNICPRGAFLDIAMSRCSRNRPVPKIITRQWFRLLLLILLMGLVAFRLLRTGGDLALIGAVFVTMCLVTTIISIVFGLVTKHRAWCMMCPMGFLQEKIGDK